MPANRDASDARATETAAEALVGEPDRQGETLPAGKAGQCRLAGLHDVPGLASGVRPVHLVIAGQVGPAVALALIAAGGPAETARREHGVAVRAVGGHERPALSRPGVIVAGHAQGGVVQDVDPVTLPGKGAELDVNEHRGTPRVGDIGLGDDVLARPRSVDLLVAQALRVEQADPMDRVGAFPIGERAAVGNDELGVSSARRVDARDSRSRSVLRC